MSGANTTRDDGAPSARWSTLRNAFLSAVAASKTAGGGADTTAGTAAVNNSGRSSSSRCINSSSGGGTGIADQEKRFEGFQLFPRWLSPRYYCYCVASIDAIVVRTSINLSACGLRNESTTQYEVYSHNKSYERLPWSVPSVSTQKSQSAGRSSCEQAAAT